MNLFLTGGTGFFGKSLLRYLLSTRSGSQDGQPETSFSSPLGVIPGTFSEFHAWQRIVVLSRDPVRFLSTYPEFSAVPRLVFHHGDMQNRESLPWGQRFTHVLHAATDSTIGPSLPPLQRYNQVVDGTRNILDLAVATGARRFLLTSSGAIYGPQPPDLAAIPEDWPGSPPLADPSSAYGQAKRTAEHLCALTGQQHGVEIVVARCFAFVGPDLPLNVHFAVGNFIRDSLTAEAITVYGDGTPLRTYLSQSDLAYWLLRLLELGRPGHAYNLGSDEVISIADLAYLVRDILAPGKPVHILGHPDLVGAAARNRYVPDIRKAQQEVGLSVTVPLAEAIRRSGAVLHRATALNEVQGLPPLS